MELSTIKCEFLSAEWFQTFNCIYRLLFFTSDNGGGKCDCPRCLSVCLSVFVSKITQKRVHGFG